MMSSNTKIIINGTFDIFHCGHANILILAKLIAPISNIIVLLDTDRRVASLKGETRPFFTLKQRSNVIRAAGIENIFSFETDGELLETISRIKSLRDTHTLITIKGSDYIGKPIIGKEYFDHILYIEKTVSSSDIIK